MSVKDFANDVLDFAKEEATSEDITFLKSKVKDMIEMLEKWKDKQKVTTT